MEAVSTTDRFNTLLMALNLRPFYPEKITLNDVVLHSIKSQKGDTCDAAWKFLEQIIMFDSGARNQCAGQSFDASSGEENVLFDADFEGIIDQSEYAEEQTIHPLDIVLVTFSCCNPFLKQSIISKMVTCRLAVPLLYFNGQGHLQCLVWSLRTIVSQHVERNRFGSDESIVVQPNKIISFIRFGETSVSKSEIMNHVLSENANETYFHRNCKLGASEKTVYGGTLEASWFIPSKERDNRFQESLMLLNLRGDALHETLQREILLDISNVIVVIINATTLDSSNSVEELFKSAHRRQRAIVLGLDSSTGSLLNVLKTVGKYRRNTGLDTSLLEVVVIKSKEKNKSLSDIGAKLSSTISTFINNQLTGKSISEFVSQPPFSTLTVNIDEDIDNCQLGKTKADIVLHTITNQSKRLILPLQDIPWLKWSILEKDYHRSSKALVLKKKIEIEDSKLKLRNDQLKMISNLHDFVKVTLRLICQLFNDKMFENLDFFLHYLQLYLDDKSRHTIPMLSNIYQQKWNAWKRLCSKKGDPSEVEKLQKEVDEAEIELFQASLGLEHVIREFSQMYESFIVPENNLRIPNDADFIKQLPDVIAYLIVNGYSFELLDGDASNIPLSWVNAVFESVFQLIGKKTVLTLSVIGIQSSGKSTLLNSMFGLEFAVKAGRCTRGVFMRLLPVNGNGYPFDYILVIDSEGLRAPELALQKYDHDNELATFVLGLADITLINIKGENTTEVQDVLQIAVHAFMKLMLVNEKMKLSQSCIFVHQNVSEENAKNKLAYATRKTVQTLDDMTRDAAKQLNIADINSFQDIIHFNSEKHVWYFPDLWLGSPPLAPTNPDYSRRVSELRKAILIDATSRQSCSSLLDIKRRINDLWGGIMSEDFVFSFRNSLEIKAYNILEKKYQELSAELNTYVFNIVQMNVKTQLASCETEEELSIVSSRCFLQLQADVARKVENLKKDLMTFFDSNQHKDIVVKWRDSTITRFQVLENEHIFDAKKDIQRLKESNRLKLLNTTKLTEDERELYKKAKELAEQFKGKEPSREELQVEFNEVWLTWLERYQPSSQQEEDPVEIRIRSALYDRFRNDRSILDQELTEQSTLRSSKIQKLENSIEPAVITNRHISIDTNILGFQKKKFSNCVKATMGVTNCVLATIDFKIDNYVKQDDRFSTIYISEPLDFLDKQFENFNNSIESFQLLSRYKVMLAVHVARYAERVYENMNARYERRYGRRAKMKEYQKNVWEIFYDAVHKKTSEYTASSLIRNIIVATTIKHVEELMQNDIEKYLKSEFGSTKPSLINTVLDSLANEEQFNTIYQYCLNARDFSSRRLTEVAQQKLFKNVRNEDSQYCKIAATHITKIYHKVLKSLESANSGTQKTSGWIDMFVKDVQTSLPISKSEFGSVLLECPSIKESINDFSDLVKSQMQTMVEDATSYFRRLNVNNITWKHGNPINKVFDETWGCEEHCPFCREPCQFTDKGHVTNRPHSCLQHKPAAIKGTYKKSDKKLTIEVCPAKIIDKDRTFSCRVCNLECRKQGNCAATDDDTRHYYHNYKQFIPTWDIPPDNTLQCSDYWSWVISTFETEINQNSEEASLPDIPQSWRRLTKERAKNSLRT